jgi:hypothetical protein
MRSLAGVLSGVPLGSCTVTVLCGAASTTAMRYCSVFSASSYRQTMSFASKPWSRSLISASGSE